MITPTQRSLIRVGLGLLLLCSVPAARAINLCLPQWSTNCACGPSGACGASVSLTYYWYPATPPAPDNVSLICPSNAPGLVVSVITNLGGVYREDTNCFQPGTGWTVPPVIVAQWWTLSFTNGTTLSGNDLAFPGFPSTNLGRATLTFCVAYTNAPPCTNAGVAYAAIELLVMDGPVTNWAGCSAATVSSPFNRSFMACVGESVSPTPPPVELNPGQWSAIIYQCPGPECDYVSTNVAYSVVSNYWQPPWPTNGFAAIGDYASSYYVVARAAEHTNVCGEVTLYAGALTCQVRATTTNTFCYTPPSLTGGAFSLATNVCAGAGVPLPGTAGFTFVDGTVRTVIKDCPTGATQTQDSPAGCTLGAAYSEPNFPGVFNQPGSYLYTFKVTATPPWESPCSAVTFTLGTFTVVVTEDKTTNAVCFAGTLTDSGTLSISNAVTCVGGGGVSFPSHSGAAFSPGTNRTEIRVCADPNSPANTNLDAAFSYSVSGYWEPASIPPPTNAGSYSFTRMIVGSPGGSGACHALTNAGPVFTVTVNPAPQTNQGCLGPFLVTPGGLASNAMTLCLSNTPALPGVTNPVYAGTNWTAYTTCSNPAWQTNFTAVNWSVTTFWLPPPARLDVVGAQGYTCYAVVSPPAGSPCAAVTNTLGSFTVNVVETFTTNFACAWSGGLATNAGPAWTNQTVCAGAGVAPPGFNGGYTNGAVRLQVFNCNNTLKLDTNLPVAYSLSGPFFEPGWPGNFPAGSTSVVLVVVGLPDNPHCAPLTNRFTITVTGTPGPVKLTLTGYTDTTKVTPGAFLALNDDDDNTNNVPDLNEGSAAVTNENDLLQVNFSASGLAPSNRITFSAAGTGTGRLKAWRSALRGTNAPVLDLTATPPVTSYSFYASNLPTLYLEGVAVSSAASDVCLTVAGDGVAGCPDKAYVTVIGVTFLDAVKTETSTLKVGKWENGFTAGPPVAVQENFIELDPDRFHVRVIDRSKQSAGKVSISLSTDSPGTDYDDNATEIELAEEPANSGVFVSTNLLMVSDDIDDDFTNGRVVADDTTNDRTHKIALPGKVKVQYPATGTTICEKEAKVPPILKSVDVSIVILRDRPLAAGGNPVIAVGVVSNFWKIAKERYAQVGVEVRWSGPTIEDPPTGVFLTNGLQVVESPASTNLANETHLLIDALGTTNTTDDIHVFYVNLVYFMGNQMGGIALAPYYFGAAADRGYLDNVILDAETSSPWGGYAAAHELGHLLTNAGHPTTNTWRLMQGELLQTNGERGSRRLIESEQSSIESNSHVH